MLSWGESFAYPPTQAKGAKSSRGKGFFSLVLIRDSLRVLPMNLRRRLTLMAACFVLAGGLVGALSAPVPTLHLTDLFRPHDDPDDHWDLASLYALAWTGQVDLRGVMIDYPKPIRTNAPDVCAVAQMNRITGKAVPLVVGSPRVPPNDTLHSQDAAAELAGIKAFLEWLRQSPRPVAIHVVGSCRDIALALRLEPKLFAKKCAAIYLNAGSGTPDPEKAKKLEWNVTLDAGSYAAVFAAPCPIYWLPCFEVVSAVPRELFRVAEYGSFYRFRQNDILPHLSERVQNYFMFMYAAGRFAGPARKELLWQQQLDGPRDTVGLAHQSKLDRNMWCTAGFLHSAGLSVNRTGEIVPLKSVRQPVFVFEPIQVCCSPSGVTEWKKDAKSKQRFILRVAEVEHYQAAMTAALKGLLQKLP